MYSKVGDVSFKIKDTLCVYRMCERLLTNYRKSKDSF